MARFESKSQIALNTVNELRTTYMLAYDDDAVSAEDVMAALDISPNHAAELLRVLNKDNLLVPSGRTDAAMWQCYETKSDEDRGAALDRVNAWLDGLGLLAAPTKVAKVRKSAPATKTNPAGLPVCLCGCGEATSRKSNYRPGHDARHVSQVVRAVRALAVPSSPADIDDLIDSLPTEKLQVKAMRAIGL